MRWWKAAGLAGFVGIAATGAVLARAERRRRAYSPDEIRARLHERLAQSAPGHSTPDHPTLPDGTDAAGDQTR